MERRHDRMKVGSNRAGRAIRPWRDATAALFLNLSASAVLLSACAGGASPDDPAEALRTAFPAHAAAILEAAPAPLSLAEEDNRAASREVKTRGLSAQFPPDGEQPIRFNLPTGNSFYVREADARGAAMAAGMALAYPRRGGRSYWARTAMGYEEWLLLDAGIACPGVEAAAWEVSGATLRKEGDAIEVVTGTGHPVVRVTAPVAYAAGGRQVPVTLAAVGARISIEVDAGCDAALVDPAWVLAAPMLSAKSSHTSTLLPDGRVLVTGGVGSNGSAKSAVELYAVDADVWSAGALMSEARSGHEATLLANGKVLVTGGWSDFMALATAETYDPVTNTWSPAAPMQKGRFHHTATLLDNGKVLVAGGFGASSDTALNAELYDPATNLWKSLPPLSASRTYHTATRLMDGRVLVWGGPGFDMFPTLSTPFDLFDPATETWTSPKELEPTRQRHTATLLPNGNVLIAGGELEGVPLATVQIYEPGSDDRTFTTPMLEERSEHTATLLSDGNVFVVGGYKVDNGSSIPLKSTEIFYVENIRWSFSAELNQMRHVHTATALLDTRVLVAGGKAGPVLASAEIFGTALGDPCATVKDCPSGFCVDGVCCDSACDLGQCDACSIAEGGSKDGECSIRIDAPCDDGFVCTEGSTCDATGACQVGSPKVCSASGECLMSSCNITTGMCEEMPKEDGAFCSVGVCESGVCQELPDAGTGGEGGAGGVGGAGGAGGEEPVKWEPFTVQGGGCSCAAAGSSRSQSEHLFLGALLGLTLTARARSRRRGSDVGKAGWRRYP